ncbi:hypothetical protein GH714_020470 [Hevea brasiliensis]|uniref:ATP phosphoribosyltransferase n=1 Tax=Hevea brasiliensis TaxID=3981 RepID=A0A6A6N5U2_HEVBR|nr:hypothetical protein GH714_020470 [Hevea brasiliensis]
MSLLTVSGSVVDGRIDTRVSERNEVRLGLPSKGRMASDTLDLLKDCQLSVKQVNPRQYVAEIPQLSNLEVWFQRPKDIVRKLLSGDLDLGIVGFDTVSEYGKGNEDLILVHDALEFLIMGFFENVKSMRELAQMPQWTAEKPLRVATGFTYLGPKFMKENGLEHVIFQLLMEHWKLHLRQWNMKMRGLSLSKKLMGIADAILDLVSSGTTLRENNLKEIEGGVVLESQAVLVASRKSLMQQKGALDTTHEILERLEAHLRAIGQFTVTANMRGSSADEVAERVSEPAIFVWVAVLWVQSCPHQAIYGNKSLRLATREAVGPTVSPVYCKRDGKVSPDYYAIVICVPKKALYKSVQQLRAIGGSGVLISPLTYIFDEETPRWRQLLSKLGL